MAYFSNGSEGGILDEQCAECVLPDNCPCPVLWVQMDFNYKQLDKKGERTMVSDVLDCLINEKGECQMKIQLDKLYPKYHGKDTCREMLDAL